MGLSKQSEKCQKCDRKDTCNNKTMEACAYIIPTIPQFAQGGLLKPETLFYFGSHDGPELMGNLGKKHQPSQDLIVESISKAVSDAIKNLEGKNFTFDILPLRKTNETN